MRGKTKVSICIPCYQQAMDVRRLLDSILQQDYTDFEVILTDDSGDDEVEQVAADYRNRIVEKTGEETSFFYQRNPVRLGHVRNWNAALIKAGGEYIKIMFSDDWFTFPTSLSRFVRMLDEYPDAVLAFSGSRQSILVGEDTQKNLKHLNRKSEGKSWDRAADEAFLAAFRKDFRILFQSDQIGAPSAVLYRRGDAVQLFDEESGFASDVFLYMELLSKAEKERERGRRAHLGKNTPKAVPEIVPEAAPETSPETVLETALGAAAEIVPGAALEIAPEAAPEILPRTSTTKAGDRGTGAAGVRDLGLCVCAGEPLTTIGIHEHQYTESFGAKDERIYKDYRLLFQKYELQKSREYSRYFADEYLAKYHKPYAEAKRLGIPFSVFVTAHLREILATVQSFIKARFMIQ